MRCPERVDAFEDLPRQVLELPAYWVTGIIAQEGCAGHLALLDPGGLRDPGRKQQIAEAASDLLLHGLRDDSAAVELVDENAQDRHSSLQLRRLLNGSLELADAGEGEVMVDGDDDAF